MTIDWSKKRTKKEIDSEKNKEKNTLLKNVLDSHINSQVSCFGYDDADAIGKFVGYENTYREECERLGLWISICYEAYKKAVNDDTYISTGEFLSKLPKLDLSV